MIKLSKVRQNIYKLVADGQDDEAIDLVFDYIDRKLLDGDFMNVDDMLDECEVEKLNTVLMLAFLAITYAARSELTCRDKFRQRVEKRLKEIEPERAEVLLKHI